ncbi:DUF1294 domain-containing protein [Proteiniclasticum sp. C24MP]|uniref:DUF1294 domain-containing protein n=1 Tax=Proteiniclasticum sp. C24MP TaxID=3374101 RepID=UPI0037545C96
MMKMNFLLEYLMIMNIFSLITMYIDKNNSKRQKRRVSEAALLALGFLGGSIGLLIGMYLFRHKTRHLKFTLGIPVILLFNLLLYVLITTTILM